MQLIALAVLGGCFGFVQAQDKWCGKPYQADSPPSPPPPESRFAVPDCSADPLLYFVCSPSVQPYVASDINALPTGIPATFVIDARISRDKGAAGTSAFTGQEGDTFSLTVAVDGLGVVAKQHNLTVMSQPQEVPFMLNLFNASEAAYAITCTASFATANYTATSTLSVLPDPTSGGVIRTDKRTGALLVPSDTNATTSWEPLLPVGFYTSFSDYLAKNLSRLDAVKHLGYTLVHPVPSFDNVTALNLVLDHMEELGLWLMYDMRGTYTNLTSVSEQVESIRGRKNLLLWYTADEPDGWQDALNATALARDTILSLDKGYHPTSLVLNCENYYFPEYSSGADIILQDTYPIGINATYSIVWGTECTPDFGDCGCDNCIGDLIKDIATRVDEFKDRARWLGRERDLAVWSVPEAFGEQSYWPRNPTGEEFAVQSVVGIIHGSLGIVPWIDPTTAAIDSAASALARSIPSLSSYILSPGAVHEILATNSTNLDAASWLVQSLGTLFFGGIPSR